MPAAEGGPGRYGVVDIGSNSIRLVVFDGLRRVPLPLFNEKVLCGIGRGVRRTGRLDPAGAARALDNLERFGALLRAMEVAAVDAVATAAVRDAADGADFAAAAERRAGFRVRILSGAEEAETSALGVLSGMPDADGLVGDLGGGSLELVRLARGQVAEHATLPLGPLNLAAAANGGGARDVIDAALAGVPWLKRAAGADLYAVGGNWRALARAHMAWSDYPLRVIHHYRLRRRELAEFAMPIARRGPDSPARLAGVPRRRLDLLPFAALAMARLLRAAKPSHVLFSALGLREGLAHARLPAQCRAGDPLAAACRDIAARAARFPALGAELAEWTAPLFPGESAAERRLRHAACLLGDIGWRVHPDHRAEQACTEVLYAPALYGDHAERAFLARAVFARYGGRGGGGAVAAERLLAPEEVARARIVGASARLGGTLSGGVSGVIQRFPLSLDRRALRLSHRPGDRNMLGESVRRRFRALAASMELEPVVRAEP